MINEETLEYGLLQHIKMCLECNNESQAIRLLEKYGFEKQEELYSEEEVEDLIYKVCGTVARLQGITLNGNHIDSAYKQFKKK